MADDTITTVGRHLAHRRPSADEVGRLTAEIEALRHDLERHIEIASQEAMRADGIEARIVAWLRREAKSARAGGCLEEAVGLMCAADKIEHREHEETAGG